jgi:replicative DNA helicase
MGLMKMNYEERTLEAEQYILGAVFIDNNVMLELILKLSPEDFLYDFHKRVFKKMCVLFSNDQVINPLSIKEDVTHLISTVTTLHTINFYIDIVKKSSIRKRAREIGHRIQMFAENKEVEDEDKFYQEIEEIMDHLRSEKRSGLITTQEMKSKYLNYLDEPIEKITTGFKRFDEWCGGLGREWLYILSARPSTGKTAKMLQMALHMSVHGQVLLFSQEMKDISLYNRMLSHLTQIPLKRVKAKELNKQERKEISDYLNVIGELYLHIGDKGSYSAEEVRAEARKIKKEHGKLKAIFVDYLGIMDIPHKSNKTYAQAVGEVSKKMKSLAMELYCPVILLCQLNRESEKSDKPSLSHLRDSGNIEQDADIVEILWKEDSNSDIVNSSIVKGRDIGTKDFKYQFQASVQKFVEMG